MLKFLATLLALFALLMPTMSIAAEAFQIPRSSVEQVVDPVSGRVYPLFIKLPRSYAKNKAKSYPVIYLTDAWYTFQIISGATRFPVNTGKMKEAIIVGISYAEGSNGSASRVRDYTHIRDSSWKMETGGAKQHASFIKDTVFPFVETRYRVDNSDRTYVGNSLGGLLGAYILFTNPDMFENYILGSPSVWFKNDDLLNLSSTPSLDRHKVYISVGALETPQQDVSPHDMVRGAKKLYTKITKSPLPNTETRFKIIEGANHETAFPTTAIQGLYWLFKKS